MKLVFTHYTPDVIRLVICHSLQVLITLNTTVSALTIV